MPQQEHLLVLLFAGICGLCDTLRAVGQEEASREASRLSGRKICFCMEVDILISDVIHAAAANCARQARSGSGAQDCLVVVVMI